MTENIFAALSFAADAHAGQFRKGTKIPYIVHPIAVMELLIRNCASTDAVVAGILHDTLEDTSITEFELRQLFGDRITDLVVGASEPDKSLSWQERKEHTVEFLRNTTDIELLMVVCADKLSNISSIKTDLDTYGDIVWTRFKRGYESQKWYYTSLADIFAKHTDKSPMFTEYINMVRSVFQN